MPSVTRNTLAGDQVILGLADIRKKMLSLPKRVGTNVIRRGLLAGAKVVGEQGRANAPVRKRADGTPAAGAGVLKRSIVWQSRGVFKDGSGSPTEHRAVVIIAKKVPGAKRSARSYAHLPEHGTAPHALGKGSISHLFRGSSRRIVQHGAVHPGSPAQRYLRRAYMDKRFAAVAMIVQVIRREMEAEIKAAAMGITRRELAKQEAA